MSEKDGLLAIGRILKPHGVRGKLKVLYFGDSLEGLRGVKEVRIGPTPEESSKFQVKRIQPQKGLFILKLKDFTLEDAKGRRGQLVWVQRDQLPPLEEGEYYWVDLIGSKVRTVEGEELGVVQNLMATGSNDVLVCHDGRREILIPVIEDVIVEVDIEGHTITVRAMEGLW